MPTIINGTTGIDLIKDGTVMQADLAPNVVGNGPAFSAYQSTAQVITSGAWTKVNLQTKEYDSAAVFDNVTNYRFQPIVSGYYQVNGCVAPNSSVTVIGAAIYKNGSPVAYGVASRPASTFDTQQVNRLVFLNGTTDYVELFVYAVGTTPTLNALGSVTYFQAFLARSA